MKQNWIEDVLIDLSKSAFNEGRLELFDAITGFVKLASNEEEVNFNEQTSSGSDKGCNDETANIICLYEHRRRRSLA